MFNGRKREKVLLEFKPDGAFQGYMIHCPACKRNHLFDSRWEFNGNMEKPTFMGSMLFRSEYRCHSFVKDGMIQLLDDCDHEMKGQTVPLVAIF